MMAPKLSLAPGSIPIVDGRPWLVFALDSKGRAQVLWTFTDERYARQCLDYHASRGRSDLYLACVHASGP